MSEFSVMGLGQAPHEEESTREHFKEVEEDVRHDRDADEVAKAHSRRPWWRFWGKRSG
jgi:hypothetical protein